MSDYEFPPRPKIKEILNGDNNTFFCDHCFSHKSIYNDKDETCIIVKSSASFLQKRNLDHHCKTKKHLEAMNLVQKAIEDKTAITCKYCGETFTKEGYERHRERNNILWLLNSSKEYGSCNNIYYNKCRFPNIEYLKNYKNAQANYLWRAKEFKKLLRRHNENKYMKPRGFMLSIIEKRLKEIGAKKKHSKANNNTD